VTSTLERFHSWKITESNPGTHQGFHEVLKEVIELSEKRGVYTVFKSDMALSDFFWRVSVFFQNLIFE